MCVWIRRSETFCISEKTKGKRTLLLERQIQHMQTNGEACTSIQMKILSLSFIETQMKSHIIDQRLLSLRKFSAKKWWVYGVAGDPPSLSSHNQYVQYNNGNKTTDLVPKLSETFWLRLYIHICSPLLLK
jgi:hypothetical protein